MVRPRHWRTAESAKMDSWIESAELLAEMLLRRRAEEIIELMDITMKEMVIRYEMVASEIQIVAVNWQRSVFYQN